MSATAVTAAVAFFLQTRFCGFQVDYANTIKTLSKSVFFAACVMEKHRVYVMGIHGRTRYRIRSHTIYIYIYWECYLGGFWHLRAKPSSLGNGQTHCKNQCFCPTKTAKTIPQWLEDLQIFSDSCATHLRGFNPAESLSLTKLSWCYYPNQHICQRRCPDFIPYRDKLILLPHSTYVPKRVPDVYPFFRLSWCYYPNQQICQRGLLR